MLFAEVEPRSSTHRPSSVFSRREISPMPLERRIRFCGAEGAAGCSEEPRNSFITFSATDAIEDCVRQLYATGLRSYRFPGLFLNIHLALEISSVFDRDALRHNIAAHHRGLLELHAVGDSDFSIQLPLDGDAFGADAGLHDSIW